MGDAAEPQLRELRIRSTETAESGGEGRIALSVFCPSRGCSTTISECHACSKCHGWQLDPDARSGRLRCHVLRDVSSPTPRLAESSKAPHPLVETDAMRTRVEEVMDFRALCIEATLPVDELMPLMIARNVARVPVVDSAGGALGIITRTDLLLRKHLDLTYRHTSSVRQVMGTRNALSVSTKEESPTVRTVRDVMSGGAFALSEAAPVARAAALMAYEGVECLVIISQHGRVVGLLSSLDIARWIAKSHGFALEES